MEWISGKISKFWNDYKKPLGTILHPLVHVGSLIPLAIGLWDFWQNNHHLVDDFPGYITAAIIVKMASGKQTSQTAWFVCWFLCINSFLNFCRVGLWI